MGTEFCQKLFVYILRWPYGLYSICWYDVSQWLVCRCWRILASLGWVPGIHHLIMVYELFNVLLDMDSEYFVDDFWIYVHQWYWPVIFSFCGIFVWFWYQGGGGLIICVGKFSFLCDFLEQFQKYTCSFFSKCLQKFSCEAIRPWAFVCWEIFNYTFNFSACDLSVHIFYFFLVQSRNTIHF